MSRVGTGPPAFAAQATRAAATGSPSRPHEQGAPHHGLRHRVRPPAGPQAEGDPGRHAAGRRQRRRQPRDHDRRGEYRGRAPAGRALPRLHGDVRHRGGRPLGRPAVHTEKVVSQPDGNTDQHPVHPPGQRRAAAVRLLHPRRRHDDRCRASTACTAPGAGSSPPKASPWPWSISATACAPSSAPEVAPVPGRPQRLRLRPEVGARQRRACWASTRRASSSPARAAAAT